MIMWFSDERNEQHTGTDMHQKHQPIRLRTDGPDIVVEMDFGVPNRVGNSYVEIIREKMNLGVIYHEVLDSGIERAKDRHYNGNT